MKIKKSIVAVLSVASCTGFAFSASPAHATDVSQNMNTPIYQSDNTITGNSLLSRYQKEINGSSTYGFNVNDGETFIASATSANGLVPIHRLWNSTSGFIFVPEGSEMTNDIKKYGFKDERVEFFASSTEATGLIPVYRLKSPTGKFSFTTDASKKNKDLSSGWTETEIAFYVKPVVADTNSNHMGVSTPWVFENTSDYQNSVFSKVAETGSQYVRIDLPMYAISKGDNEPYTYDFTRADVLVNNALKNGLTPLVILSTLPGNLVPNADGNPNSIATGPTTPHQVQAYTDYVKAIVTRYKDKINNWEIWNEENLSGSWGGGKNNPNQPSPSAQNYTNLLKSVYPAIKSIQPQSTVLVGGTGDADGNGDISSQNFIKQLYADGAKNFFDAMAVHVYADWSNNGTEFIDQLPTYRTIMDSNGDNHKKLWITESGERVVSGTSTVDQQKTMEDYTVEKWKSIHDRGPLFVFTMMNDVDPGFGLLNDDGSRRPAFMEWQKIAANSFIA